MIDKKFTEDFLQNFSLFIPHHLPSKGESALLKENFLELKNKKKIDSTQLNSFDFWYKKACTFFAYGQKNREINSLLLTKKSLKKALQIEENSFSAQFLLAKTFFELGKQTTEHHYLQKAYENYLLAEKLSTEVKEILLKELHTDLGVLETYFAEKSGEAFDICKAISSFRTALRYQKNPDSFFWNAFGKAYYQMGLFVNDNRHYLQAIAHFNKALSEEPQNPSIWLSLGSTYKELFINTASEEYFKESSYAYQKSCQYDDLNEEVWFDWATILHESGKINQDPKKLRLAIEKCVRAHSLAPNDPKILGQWVESLSVLGAISARHDLIIEAENKIIKATSRFPHSPELWYAYAVCLGAQADYYKDPAFYDFGIEKIQEGLSLNSSIAELWHLLALFHSKLGQHFQDQKLLKLAEKFFFKALDLKPSCPTLLFDSSCNSLSLAELLESIEDAQKAHEGFEALIHLQKNSLLHHPDWIFSYACSLYVLGDLCSSEAFLLKSVEAFWQVLLIEPEYTDIHRKIAICFSQLADFEGSSPLYDKAFHYFQIATKRDPENESTWLEWGLTLIHFAHHTFDAKKEYQAYLEAEKKIRKAGEFGCEHAYYHLACLYSLMGRLSESMRFLELANQKNFLPPLEDIIADDWLEALRNTPHFSLFLTHLERG